MVYITGDLHGDIQRLKNASMKKLKKGDSLIVCGDFGFIWDGSKKEQKLLQWIGKRKYNVLFVEGAHDNLELLQQYPTTEWNGGLVHEISGNLRHLCRSQIFYLEGSSIFTFGGGKPAFAEVDTHDESWWKQQLPSPEEIDAAHNALKRQAHQVDYIITHQCSHNIKSFLAMAGDKFLEDDITVLDLFLDEIRSTCRYKRWFFGSYHINKVIPPHECALFDAVMPIHAEKLPPV